jgi:hypothetical protein
VLPGSDLAAGVFVTGLPRRSAKLANALLFATMGITGATARPAGSYFSGAR